MPSVIFSKYGTGLAGSLTYSSWLSSDFVSAGGSSRSLPPAWKCSARGLAFFGGQASCLRQTLVPVSKTQASGWGGVVLPFR